MMSQNKLATLYLLIIIISLYVLAIYIQANLLLNVDVSYLMLATKRMLAGGTYANDFFDPNPPMILYLYIPPVLLTKYFHINKIIALNSYILFLTTVSLSCAYFFIQRLIAIRSVFLANFFLIASAFVLLIAPVSDFGQREHVFTILTFPYLLMMAYRLTRQSVNCYLAAFVGLMAGLGFAIKPYFIITFLLVELYYAISLRKILASVLRIENAVIFSVFIAYCFSVWIFFPDYLSIIIPYTMRHHNPSSGAPWELVITNPLAVFCYFSLIFYLTQYKKNLFDAPANIIGGIFSIAICGMLLTHFIQDNHWFYHILPAIMLSILLDAYLFGLFILDNQKLKDYIIFIILVLLPSYWLIYANGNSAWTLIVFNPTLVFCFIAVMMGIVLFSEISRHREVLCYIFLITGSAYLFTSTLKKTSFYTHQFSLTMLFLFLLFSLVVQRYKNNHKYIISIVAAIIVFIYPSYLIYDRFCYFSRIKQEIQPFYTFLQTHASQQAVYFIAGNIYDFPAIDYVDILPSSRFPFFWMLPSIVNRSIAHNSSQLMADKKLMLDMTAEDLNKNQPKLVFIQTMDKLHYIYHTDVVNHQIVYNDVQFKFLPYFLQNKNFQLAWEKYHYSQTVDLRLHNTIYKFRVYART